MPNDPLVKITARRDKDPTRSNAILSRYFAEIKKRFGKLKKDVEEHIMDPTTLKGKKETESNPGQLIVMAERYVYEKSLDRMKEFMLWLDQQVLDGILTVESRPWLVSPSAESFWADKYIQSSYQKGIETARADMASAGATLPELGPVSVARNKPFHADRLGLIFSRTFNGMKGLTDVMKAQMGRELAKGMGEGRSPYDIAYKLKDRVDKIGITRARLIARTEVIFAHNSAAVNEYESLEGLIGEEIKVQWWTALDERVRASHRERHGRIYKKQRAQELIGEPNCRCTLLPWTKTLWDMFMRMDTKKEYQRKKNLSS